MSDVADKPKTNRVTVTLKLSEAAGRIVETIKDDTGVTNVAAMERLLEWFSGIDRRFRLAILNRDEETRRQLAVDALARMAGVPEGLVSGPGVRPAADLTPDEAIAALRVLTESLAGHLRRTESDEHPSGAPSGPLPIKGPVYKPARSAAKSDPGSSPKK